MKKYLLFPFILLIFNSGQMIFSQTFEILNGDTINYVDANNMKQGAWKINNKTKKLPGYEDSQLVEEGDYVNNKKEGIWNQYYNNGKLKSEITYSNNLPKGYAKFYYKNGFISEEGSWVNNKWEGKYKYYYETGQIAYDWNFVNGKREGNQKYYYENGQLHYDGDWLKGEESGILKEYNEDGQLIADKMYNKGKIDTVASKYYKPLPIKKQEEEQKKSDVEVQEIEQKSNDPLGYFTGTGNHILYNDKKKVSREGYFEKGHLINGKEYKYSSDGKLIKTLVFKNGKITEVIE